MEEEDELEAMMADGKSNFVAAGDDDDNDDESSDEEEGEEVVVWLDGFTCRCQWSDARVIS